MLEEKLYSSLDIKRISVNRKTNNDDYFLFNWYMTGWCNYHCPYCIASSIRNSWIEEEVMINRAKAINRLARIKMARGKKIALKLLGGEVTYYNLPKVLDHIKYIDKISLMTNLSRDVECFKEFANYCEQRKIKLVIICSWHEENSDFIKKYHELCSWYTEKSNHSYWYKVPQLNIVVNNDFDWKLLDEFSDIDKTRIRLIPERNQNQSKVKLNQETLNKVLKASYEFEAARNQKNYLVEFENDSFYFSSGVNILNFLDNGGFISENCECTSGIDAIAIQPNGDLTAASCYFLENTILGNLSDLSNFSFPTKPVICKLNSELGEDYRCDLTCGVDIKRCKK